MTTPPDPFVEICMLSHANWDDTERALRSAWRLGLHVHLGVTVDEICPFKNSNLTTYSCPWTDDFAAARNSLLDQITSESPYFLWIDSDEELICCPAELPIGTNDPFLRVKVSIQTGLTSCNRECMHRNDPGIRWSGAVHERLGFVSGEIFPMPDIISGMAIIHHGYEDRGREVTKLSRNAVIADAAINEGRADAGATASIARERTALGQATAFDWLAHYKAMEALALSRGRPLDMCWEAASALSFCGYTRPAERLTEENPLNVPMQLALLTTHYARTGGVDPVRLAFVLTCLQRILWDDRFAFETSLINSTQEELVDYITQQAATLGWDKTVISSDGWNAAMANDMLFVQSDDILLETFEDDTLLLSPVTNRVVSLNASGKVFWDALANCASVEACASLLTEASDVAASPEAFAHIEGFFQNLLESGMIREA